MMKKITLFLMLLVASFGFSQSLPFDFSSENQLMTGDGGATTSIVKEGDNDVLQLVGATAPWDNAQINFSTNVDLSDDANNTITFKIKPVNGTGSGVHLLKLELPASGGTTELDFTTTGTDWQTITLDFGAGLSNYGRIVIFTDKGEDNAGVSDTYLIDDIAGAKNFEGEAPVVVLPFDFSSESQLMTGDGGTTTSIIKEGDNDVLQLVGATAPWDNAQINFSTNVDLSDNANNTITFKIKPVNGTGSGDHLLKFEAASVGGDQQLDFTTTGTDWQTITLDFGAGLSTYGKMVIFTDKGEDNAGVSDTYLIDDIAVGASETSEPEVVLPFDFSSESQLMMGDGGTATSIVKEGDNDVLQLVGATAPWDNAQINFTTNVDLSDDANNTITFKIKPVNGTGSGDHLLKFEAASVGGDQQLDFTTTGTDWQTITLDFGAGLSTYGKMVIFTDKGEDNAGVSDTYLIDDIAVSASEGGGGETSEGYCETVVTHFGIAAETASAIKLTIANSGEKTMKVTVESNDADPVDELVIPAVTGSPAVSAKDTSVAGKISVTLTWENAPTTDIDINVLWSKVSFAGNWQLSEDPVTVKFDASCSTASVDKNNLLKVSLYPNPASDNLKIRAQNTIKNVSIYNVLGKQVQQVIINNKSGNIDVSSLSTGIYILKYSVNNTVGTMKFIKK